MCSCTPDARHSAKNIDCQQNQRPYIPCLPQDPLFKSDQQCIETPFPPQKFCMSERLLAHPVAPPSPPEGRLGWGATRQYCGGRLPLAWAQGALPRSFSMSERLLTHPQALSQVARGGANLHGKVSVALPYSFSVSGKPLVGSLWGSRFGRLHVLSRKKACRPTSKSSTWKSHFTKFKRPCNVVFLCREGSCRSSGNFLKIF